MSTFSFSYVVFVVVVVVDFVLSCNVLVVKLRKLRNVDVSRET